MSKCKHPYYHIVDGKLICVQCGEPSPRYTQSSSNPEEAGEESGITQEAETTEKSAEKPEDKMMPKPEDKSVKKLGDTKK